MITCDPVRPFSNRFNLEGLNEPISLKLKGFTEKGSITVGDKLFKVAKYGPTSGFWTVESGGVIEMSAEKSSAFKRRFEIRNKEIILQLVPRSLFTRSFDLVRDNEVIGHITPNHPATRRSVIDIRIKELDPTTIAFCFWLCAVSWRRAKG